MIFSLLLDCDRNSSGGYQQSGEISARHEQVKRHDIFVNTRWGNLQPRAGWMPNGTDSYFLLIFFIYLFFFLWQANQLDHLAAMSTNRTGASVETDEQEIFRLLQLPSCLPACASFAALSLFQIDKFRNGIPAWLRVYLFISCTATRRPIPLRLHCKQLHNSRHLINRLRWNEIIDSKIESILVAPHCWCRHPSTLIRLDGDAIRFGKSIVSAAKGTTDSSRIIVGIHHPAVV